MHISSTAKAEIFSQQYMPHNETHTVTKYPPPKFTENTLNYRKTKRLYNTYTDTNFIRLTLQLKRNKII